MNAAKLAALALLSTIGPSFFAEDWPQYRGPNHNGVSSEQMPLWPKGELKPLWHAPTANGFSSFTVKDGRAFTLVSRDVEGAPR
jgi:hypothetical protein